MKFFFSQYPVLSHDTIVEVLCGRGLRGRGLLETIGGVSWKTRQIKSSGREALDLLLRLLDPAEHPRMMDCTYSN